MAVVGRAVGAAAVVLVCGLAAPDVLAYSGAGDRLFPATLLLPQIAPGDEFYVNFQTLPQNGGTSRVSNLSGTLVKTITDRLSLQIEETYTGIGQRGAGTLYGWQNQDAELKYLAITDIPHEFLLSVGLDREFGGTGAARVGAARSGATTPRVYFGKGLGDLDIGYLRPLAIAGEAGVQIADSAPRPSLATAGFVLQYSIPYLQSKVHSFDLPDFIRGMTPMTEIVFNTPAGTSFGARTTALIAPGISYAGEGWEVAVEALVPMSRATGKGVGVTAQFHLALDYLFADSIGRPLVSSR